MSRAFCCEVCDREPQWRIERIGDVALTWACDQDLAALCRRYQRDFEVTELVVSDCIKRREWVAAGRMS